MNKKEFYESLTEEVKEKIKACKNEAEMLKVLEEERIELSPDLLDAVAGGGIEGQGGCTWLYCDHCSCD